MLMNIFVYNMEHMIDVSENKSNLEQVLFQNGFPVPSNVFDCPQVCQNMFQPFNQVPNISTQRIHFWSSLQNTCTDNLSGYTVEILGEEMFSELPAAWLHGANYM